MMRQWSSAVLFALVVVACGGGTTSIRAEPLVGVTTARPSITTMTPPTPTAAPTTTPATAPPPTSFSIPDGAGVAIEAVGTVVEDRRGRVLCPMQWTGACPGLPLSGGELPGVGDQVRVGGRYDGVSLEVAWTSQWAPPEFGPLHNPCTGETNGHQAGQDPIDAMGMVMEGHMDRYAGSWISDGQVVVALTGPDDELAAELRGLDDVCVVTGYASSAEELVTLTEGEITPLLLAKGPPFAFAGADGVPETKIVIEGDAVDGATVTMLTEDYGPVEVQTFITVLDAAVADLPVQQPLVPGDVTVPTGGMRLEDGMAALWTGVVLEYDPDLNCLYVKNGPNRTVIVWPFGHTALAGDQVQVFDPAGNVVAETTMAMELGGGHVGVDGVEPEQRCDATSAFQMGGPTEYDFRQ
ncbi:MAG: hypothetical protein ACRDVD_07985 [Acidimicrobiia bacterium]